MDNPTSRIAGLLLIFSMLALRLQLTEGQCDFPVMWEREWWVSSTQTKQFTAAVPGTVLVTTSGNQATELCQDYHEPTDQWRYYVSTLSSAAQCHRVYHDSNIFVSMTGQYTGSTANYDAQQCDNDTLYAQDDTTSVYIDETPEVNDCFATFDATYAGTFANHETETDVCAAEADTSRVVVTENTLTISACANAPDLNGKVFTCLGRVASPYFGRPAGDELVILSDATQTPNRYYCSRFRRVTDEMRVYISIDMTDSDGVNCQRDVSAETAKDDGAMQFRALIIERLLCEPTNGCQNGATCVEPAAPVVPFDAEAYTCVCVTGFVGNRCQTFLYCEDQTRCTSPQRGTCAEGGVSLPYTCTCNPGYTGLNCETALICVLNAPCQNGGTCEEGIGDTYSCDCPTGYTGNDCETRLMCVLTSQCQNGATCEEAPGDDVTCICAEGFTGEFCQTRLVCVLDAPCENGANCLEAPGDNFVCECPNGYTGDRCETALICVLNDPCENGATCTEDIGDNVICTCANGYTGNLCETQLVCILNNPCENGGTCREIDGEDRAECDCVVGYTGAMCETRLYCVPNQCLNGGSCIEVTNDFSCNCPEEFTGDLCQTPVYCVSDPCMNGGTCSEAIGTFNCTCPTTPVTYIGDRCDIRLYCQPNDPCLNGGTCFEMGNGYTCTCPEGFSGDNCEVEGNCGFPSSWQGVWYIRDDLYAEFTDNKVYYRTTPSTSPISGGSYHCEDYFLSTGVGDWRYYVRSPLNLADEESCIRTHHDENLLVHFDEATGVTSNPPTAEECEIQASFDGNPDIMIQHPFDFASTNCFSQITGKYYAKYSTFINENRCSNENQYLYSSTVDIDNNVMDVNTCYSGTGEPLRGVQLMCVGLLDPTYIGDDLTDPIIILAEYRSGAAGPPSSPDNFYCGRMRDNTDDPVEPRIYLSVDITPRDQLQCLTGVTANTAKSGVGQDQYRSLELMAVFCEPNNPCMNGGACSENNGIDFSCACADGFTGMLCETDIDECASSPCTNGGTCDDGIASYTCNCPAGFNGTNCQLIDGCESSPCRNGGTCEPTDMDGNYLCRCQAGYTGNQCQTDIDECDSSPCQHGGTCRNLENSYTCTCARGFSGTNCQDIDGCISSPCMNGGVCRPVDTSGNYNCDCRTRFEGNRCQTEIFCTGIVCENGGTCQEVAAASDYTCNCADGFAGRHCEDDLFCYDDPCENGGTCDEVTDTCECDGDWEGRFCDDDGGFNWLIFGTVVAVIGGLITLALLIWGICYCARMGRDPPVKNEPKSFVQAYPVVPPTYIAASPAPTIIAGPTAQMAAVTYASSPSIYGTQPNVRNGLGVSNPPPKISIRRSRPSGTSTLPSRSGPSIIPLAPNPSNGILVNRPPEPRTEGSLMGEVLDAEFYPDIDV